MGQLIQYGLLKTNQSVKIKYVVLLMTTLEQIMDCVWDVKMRSITILSEHGFLQETTVQRVDKYGPITSCT